MKIYIVKGTHWNVPGEPTSAHFSPGAAAASAAELVNVMVGDLRDGYASDVEAVASHSGQPLDDATPDNWADVLHRVQAVRALCESGDLEDALAVLADPFGAESVSACDVWIEELDAEAPATVRVWFAAYDGDSGTATEAFTSEQAMQDWLFDQAGSNRAGYEAWLAEQPADGEAECDDFLRECNNHVGNLDTWSWSYTDVPVPGVGQPARVVVNVHGGLVQDVSADVPVDVAVIDWDVEGGDGVAEFPDATGDMAPANLSIEQPAINPEWVNTLHRLARGDEPSAGHAEAPEKGMSILHLETVPVLSEYRVDLARVRQKAMGAIMAMPHLPHSFTAVQDALKETTALVEQLVIALQMEALRQENAK